MRRCYYKSQKLALTLNEHEIASVTICVPFMVKILDVEKLFSRFTTVLCVTILIRRKLRKVQVLIVKLFPFSFLKKDFILFKVKGKCKTLTDSVLITDHLNLYFILINEIVS